jgi:4-amino-4-deoxy-L-arabinose transferase-like glycosyltransferase
MSKPLPASHPSDLGTRCFWWSLVGIFIAAFALRIACTAAFQGIATPQSHNVGLDPLDYEMFAYEMSIGHGYVLDSGEPSARRTPGTSLTLLPVYVALGRNYFAARVWWCAISAATVIAVGWLGSLVASRRVGLVAALLLAFYPGHFYYAMHFGSEVPFGLLTVGAIGLLILGVRRSSFVLVALSGMCWGLAALVRGQVLLLLPVVLLLMCLTREGRRNCRYYATALVTSGLVISPWILRNYLVFGKPTMALLLSAYTFWGAHNDTVLQHPELHGLWAFHVDADHVFEGTEVERDATAWRYSREWLQDHWRDMPWLTVMKLWRLIAPFERTGNRYVYWIFAISWIPVAPLCVIGWRMFYLQNRRAATLALLPAIASLLATIGFCGCIRYRDAVAPFLMLFAAICLADVAGRIMAYRNKRDNRVPSEIVSLAN